MRRSLQSNVLAYSFRIGVTRHRCSFEDIQEKNILGPVQVGDNFRIGFNNESYKLCNDMDV